MNVTLPPQSPPVEKCCAHGENTWRASCDTCTTWHQARIATERALAALAPVAA